jgi:hypothetical protein
MQVIDEGENEQMILKRNSPMQWSHAIFVSNVEWNLIHYHFMNQYLREQQNQITKKQKHELSTKQDSLILLL